MSKILLVVPALAVAQTVVEQPIEELLKHPIAQKLVNLATEEAALVPQPIEVDEEEDQGESSGDEEVEEESDADSDVEDSDDEESESDDEPVAEETQLFDPSAWASDAAQAQAEAAQASADAAQAAAEKTQADASSAWDSAMPDATAAAGQAAADAQAAAEAEAQKLNPMNGWNLAATEAESYGDEEEKKEDGESDEESDGEDSESDSEEEKEDDEETQSEDEDEEEQVEHQEKLEAGKLAHGSGEIKPNKWGGPKNNETHPDDKPATTALFSTEFEEPQKTSWGTYIMASVPIFAAGFYLAKKRDTADDQFEKV